MELVNVGIEHAAVVARDAVRCLCGGRQRWERGVVVLGRWRVYWRGVHGGRRGSPFLFEVLQHVNDRCGYSAPSR